MLGMTIGMTPNAAYFASTSSTRTAGGIAGYGRPVELDDVHQRAQVLALDDELARHRLRRAASRRCVVTPSIIDSASAADLHDEHDAHQRQAAAAGQQEERAQRRSRGQLERQLETRLRFAGAGLDLHRRQRLDESFGAGIGTGPM